MYFIEIKKIQLFFFFFLKKKKKKNKIFKKLTPQKKRENYIKRHKVNADWNKINPASLSRFILWGDSTNINDNIEDYKKRFKI